MRLDHWATKLGKGMMLGFVKATVRVFDFDANAAADADAKQLADWLPRVGLLGRAGTNDAVVRYSSFGFPGKAGLLLSRLALKIDFPPTFSESPESDSTTSSGCWSDEINWLFTDTLPEFPMGGYDDLAVFSKDKNITGFAWFVAQWHAAVAMLPHIKKVVHSSKHVELENKDYNSQLPYALGNKHAMRMQLCPKGELSAADSPE